MKSYLCERSLSSKRAEMSIMRGPKSWQPCLCSSHRPRCPGYGHSAHSDRSSSPPRVVPLLTYKQLNNNGVGIGIPVLKGQRIAEYGMGTLIGSRWCLEPFVSLITILATSTLGGCMKARSCEFELLWISLPTKS
jgi:hypothetical protein